MDAIRAAKRHLQGNGATTPFFVAFDTAANLRSLCDTLASCKTMRLSDLCPSADSLPDLNALAHQLRKAEGMILLLGVGEYAALAGDADFMRRVFALQSDKARIVVPIWRGHEFLAMETRSDPRILGRRGAEFPVTGAHWSVQAFREGLVEHPDANGFKALLRMLEDGCDETVSAVTNVVPLDTDWCRRIGSAWMAYKLRHPTSEVPEAMFSEKQWQRFLDDGREQDSSIESADTFLAFLEKGTDDAYLKWVLAKTGRHDDWRHNLLTAILEVEPGDGRFTRLYACRKKLLGMFSASDMADFIRESRIVSDPAERIRYYTDTTEAEREEIVRLVAELESVPDAVECIYPALWNYVRDFQFSCGELAAPLSEYFRDYKREKIFNRLSHCFLDKVRDLAEDRPQFALPTRESVLEQYKNSNATLCWVDALGCEFLGLIQSAAERWGLKIKVSSVRVKLPSITSVNRGFFDEWEGKKMPPVKALDKIKHGEFESVADDRTLFATHLAYEIDVIGKVVEEIASKLRDLHTDKVVLTGDHGATRLAILAGRETVWEMPEKGKHGGRCCRKSEFDGDLPLCVTESDDEAWHVLAGYDRFKGGRKGDVEVHGGATIEEMVVPVVEFALLDSDLRIRLTQDFFKVTFRDREITLPFFCSAPIAAPSVELDGSRHPATPKGDGHYAAPIPKPDAGEHRAFVYDGDTKIGEVQFTVTSGGAQIQKDDFF